METQNINVDMDDDDIEQFISDDMNMTKGQVYTRMSRGKKRLRDYYINCKESSYERCI